MPLQVGRPVDNCRHTIPERGKQRHSDAPRHDQINESMNPETSSPSQKRPKHTSTESGMGSTANPHRRRSRAAPGPPSQEGNIAGSSGGLTSAEYGEQMNQSWHCTAYQHVKSWAASELSEAMEV